MDLKTLEIKIARSENLPALPQVVTQVLKLADNPTSSARQVEQVIERDVSMSAKILRVANSSYYGNGAVPSISRAVSLLGLNTLRSLVVSVAYHQIASGKNQSTKFDKRQFWKHSLAAATTARILGRMRMPAKAEELFGAAMMHDIGLIVLDKFAPEPLDEALAMVARENCSINHALQAVLGYDQSDVGFALAQRWSLSLLMREAIRYAYTPFESENMEVACIIALSSQIADRAGYVNNSTISDESFSQDLLDVVNLPVEQCDSIVAVVSAEVSKSAGAFGIR